MVSVIIPAHNEENVISQTLIELLPGVTKGEFQVIVVCNGCIDNTAGVVKSISSKFQCIETKTASKALALNLGDSLAQNYPRIYLDADVVVSYYSICEIEKVLHSGDYHAASPRMEMDFHNASWPVCAYYKIWSNLPYVKAGMIGTGLYALSETGRKRFDKFPLIIGDDRYIRALFKEHERTLVSTCCSVVRAPANLKALLRIKTRSRLGGYEFERKFPELISNEKKDYGRAIIENLKQLNSYPALVVYLFVNLWSRWRARWQLHHNLVNVWERDETSRNT